MKYCIYDVENYQYLSSYKTWEYHDSIFTEPLVFDSQRAAYMYINDYESDNLQLKVLPLRRIKSWQIIGS